MPGFPVTHREYAASFTVLTGHEDPGKPPSALDWAKLADPHRTLVMLMATANLREIAQRARRTRPRRVDAGRGSFKTARARASAP